VVFAGTGCLDYEEMKPLPEETPDERPRAPEPPPPEPILLPPDDTAPEPVEPPAPIVVPEALPGAQLFGDAQVLEVHLTLSALDQMLLEQNGNDEVYVPAQARIRGAGIGEVVYSQIGMRHKGAYSLHHCWNDAGVRSYTGSCAKLSYKLKFDEYTDDRLDGVKRLNLHASSSDATRLRELVAYSTFRDFGVAAPRTAIARVYVNGVFEGLFIAVEAVDGRFTKAHFSEGGGDGNLYKEIWPRGGLDGDE
jgi:spore coat protein H